MVSAALAPDLAAFIVDHLLTLDAIEVLTAVADQPDRWWDPKLIYTELGIPAAAARALLDQLAGINLLDIRVTGEVRYRFQPGTPELGQLVARLVAAYRSDRAAVVRTATATARRGLLDFANAFRLRKDDRGSR